MSVENGPEAEVSAPVQLGVPGSVVVTRGSGDGGADTLAIWLVSPQGAPTGAWVFTAEEAFGDEATARSLLTLVERRGVTGMVPDDVERTLEELTTAAKLKAKRWWELHLFSAAVAFEETLARRTEIEKVVEDNRAVKNTAPLEWSTDLTGYSVREIDDLRRIAGLGKLSGDRPGDVAILVSRVLKWLTQRWTETEQVKNRRAYVRDALGEPQALPPSWLATVQAASTTVLPLRHSS